MELGIHLVAAKSLDTAHKQYEQCMSQIGPDYIWLSDRLLVDDYSALSTFYGEPSEDSDPPAEFLDPFVVMASLAKYEARQPQFGVAVTDFIRRGAPDLARAAYTLNQLLHTPLNIGFGAGEAINLTPLGYRHGPKPVSFLEENLRHFKDINESGRCNCGTHRAIKIGYQSRPSTIWIGGQRERMLRITASYAHGWLPAWKMSPAKYGESAAILQEIAAANDNPCPKLGLFAMPVIGQSKAALLDYFRSSPRIRSVALMASADLWRKWGVEHPAGSESKGLYDAIVGDIPGHRLHAALTAVPAEMIDDILFLGSLQEILDEFWLFKLAGAQHLSLLLPDFGNSRISYGIDNFELQFRQLCKEVKSWE